MVNSLQQARCNPTRRRFSGLHPRISSEFRVGDAELGLSLQESNPQDPAKFSKSRYRSSSAMSAITCSFLVLALFLCFGCAPGHHQSAVGRWTMSSTGDTIVLSKNGSAEMMRQGKALVGHYRMAAPDVLILSFPSSTPLVQPQVLGFLIRPEDWKSRTLRLLADSGQARFDHPTTTQ